MGDEQELDVDPGTVTAMLLADSGWHHFDRGALRIGAFRFGASSFGPGIRFPSPNLGTVTARIDAVRGVAVAN